MTMTLTQSVITIAAVAFATLLTRLLPFLFFPKGHPVPPAVRYLGQALPTAVIAMLVVYCLKDAVFKADHALPEFIALAALILLHKLFHSMMVTVIGGTACYMLLVQYVFVS